MVRRPCDILLRMPGHTIKLKHDLWQEKRKRLVKETAVCVKENLEHLLHLMYYCVMLYLTSLSVHRLLSILTACVVSGLPATNTHPSKGVLQDMYASPFLHTSVAALCCSGMPAVCLSVETESSFTAVVAATYDGCSRSTVCSRKLKVSAMHLCGSSEEHMCIAHH